MSVQSYFLDNNCDDVVIWGTAFAGVYQAKHAYRWLIHTPSSLLARFEKWSWMWSLKLLEISNTLNGFFYMEAYLLAFLLSSPFVFCFFV